MGVVATAAIKNNGRVHGVVPVALVPSERQVSPDVDLPPELRQPSRSDEKPLDRSIVTFVTSMHDRKRFLARAGQKGFLVLPGGYGTLEEVAEMVTWTQLNIHSKRACLSVCQPGDGDLWLTAKQPSSC
jgi:predicted Rossmann-fold nucleotide-binding protein